MQRAVSPNTVLRSLATVRRRTVTVLFAVCSYTIFYYFIYNKFILGSKRGDVTAGCKAPLPFSPFSLRALLLLVKISCRVPELSGIDGTGNASNDYADSRTDSRND